MKTEIRLGACPSCRRRIPVTRALSQLKPRPFGCRGCGERIVRASGMGWLCVGLFVMLWTAKTFLGLSGVPFAAAMAVAVLLILLVPIFLTPVAKAGQAGASSPSRT
ncbi:hypothetical protein ACFPIF_01235 [Brevundimonas faecalis]|uniref:hypothetical protein n=1 Tax=Brevundimonas faecalis TaxID=947378 RepID=UPI003609168A